MKKIFAVTLGLLLLAATVYAIDYTKVTDTTIESSESVATSSLEWASDTGGTVIDATSASEWFDVVNIQVSVTFNASGTEDAEVHVRKSVDDGTTEDTEEEGTYLGTIPCTAGSTITKTFPVYNFDYLDVGLKNTDDSYTVDWSAQYDGYKVTGMN